MKTLRNWLTMIAVVIGIKVLFAISGQMADTSPSSPVKHSQQARSMVEATAQQAEPTEGFERLDLLDGVQIDVPLQWERLPTELTSAIRTSAQALLSNAGVEAGPDNSRLIIAYNSRPTTTYASLRVKEVVPGSLTPEELLEASELELSFLAQELVHLMSGPMASQGQELQPGLTTTRELVSGHPALVIRYRRMGDSGIVAVEQIKIMTPGREVAVTLAYRESEKLLWVPVVENIRRSIRVPG